jgi:hypothetical protein
MQPQSREHNEGCRRHGRTGEAAFRKDAALERAQDRGQRDCCEASKKSALAGGREVENPEADREGKLTIAAVALASATDAASSPMPAMTSA